MKRHRLLVAAAILGISAPLVATSTSSPAVAQYGNDSYHESGRDTDNRGDHGYPQYPRIQTMRRVSFLARAVEGSAVRLEHDTFARRDSLSWRERRALNQIQALTSAASHFRAQVQSFQRDPFHTQADFDRLVRAFYTAGRALDEVEASGTARRDYENLRVRMEELMRSYGGASRWSRYTYTPRGPYNAPYDR